MTAEWASGTDWRSVSQLQDGGECVTAALELVVGQFPISALIRRIVESSYYLARRATDTLGVFSRSNQTEHLEVCPESPMQ